MNNKALGVILAIFFGWCGGYRFYKKQPIVGIIYLFSFGLFGIGWFVDILLAIKDCKEPAIYSNTYIQNTQQNNNPIPTAHYNSNTVVKRKHGIKSIATFSTSLTNTFYYKYELENLPLKAPLYVEPPIGKQRSFRVKALYEDDFKNIGTLPADVSQTLLQQYPNCNYIIRSHHVTFANNGGVGCDIVLEVRKS